GLWKSFTPVPPSRWRKNATETAQQLFAAAPQRLPDAGPGFPWSTLLINVSGSFLIGIVLELSLKGALSGEARLFLAMGLLGGYTTFSTFSWETLTLVQGGEWLRALGYVLGSVLLGFAGVVAGYWLGERLGG
ncbi:fluoride efflux transporter CrcB, partial [Calidithermus roseus]|uniref:fluoride efflux transporter CrcB n=1 Tax=Calidithermus roseus TaxID=1644118 RepID=UPI001FE89716